MENLISKILSSHTTYGKPGGLYLDGPTILVLPVLAALAAIFIASLVWLGRDAKARGKHPIVAMLFVLLTGWPASFIWWYWLRPPLAERVTTTDIELPPVPATSRI